MRLRTFTAPDMPTAMRQVREALGENAIILTSHSDKGVGIKITAAVEQEEEASSSAAHRAVGDLSKIARDPRLGHASPRMTKNNPAADQLRFEIQNILRFHNLPELFIAKIIHKTSDAELMSIVSLHNTSRERSRTHLFRMTMEKLLGAYFTFSPIHFPTHSEGHLKGRSTRIMLIGPPGIGKTLTIAKLATRLTMDKQPLAVFTTDTKRAGGVEQLQAFTTILGLPLIIASNSASLRQHLSALPPHTRVLIDTAGCNPYGAAELDELKSYGSLPGIEAVMALPAGGDSLEAIDMVEAFAAVLPVERLLVTHADMARRFGGVLAAAASHGLSFCNASVSSSIADSLQPLDPVLLAQFLLQYQLQSD